MGERVAFVILGGTGDLARKKLYPSLYNLFEKGKLEDFDIVGTSRHEYTNESYKEEVSEHIKDKERWQEFRERIHFAQLNFYDEESYNNLKEDIKECGEHRLFYLATLPQHFETITKNLAKHDLVNERSKVLYEKPFGDDLESAKKLNQCIHQTFSEDKVYRIDHYLNKELIGNIAVLRFTNSMMEPVWNHLHIDQIQIIMSEDFGVGGRGEFYDQYGAIKDVFQNHLLQLLALTTMEEPNHFNSEDLRDEKVRLINSVRVEEVITGQYDGYLDEEGVKEGSDTETFAAMKVAIDNERWPGVPIYMVSGKNLEKETVKVYVEFKNTACDLFEGICPLEPNHLVISLKPDKNVYFTINTKTPGEMTMTPAKMEFSYSGKHGSVPAAYENVFWEAMKGNQTAFVRSDEIEAEWRVIDDIKKPEPFTYEKGKFPDQAREFIKKDGKEWHDL